MLRFFAFLLITSLCICCAQQKPLQGGPKDTVPPKFLSAIPDQLSVGISKDLKEAKLFFDKDVILKNIQREITVSPAPKISFSFFPKKNAEKYITIKFNEPLEEEITYIINFGKSIEDNTEGNKLEFFKYTFSTSNKIDSIKIKGRVKDAYEKKIPEHVIVGLYQSKEEGFDDTLIEKKNPYYLTKTDKEGNYTLENLKKGVYVLVAFTDPSSTYRYNNRKEKLGFLSEVISLEKDEQFDLRLAKQHLPFKALLPKQKERGVIHFSFEGDLKNVEIRSVEKLERSLILPYYTEGYIEYWYKRASDDNKKADDKLGFEIYKEKELKSKLTVKLEKIDLQKDGFSLKRESPLLSRETPIWFSSQSPLFSIDEKKIKLQNSKGEELSFSLIKDPLNLKKIGIDFLKTFEAEYKVIFETEAIEDISGIKNTPLSFELKIGKENDFGSLKLQLTSIPKRPFWIQLLDTKEKVVQEFYGKEKQYYFKDIAPGAYQLRLLVDENEDKIWDPGNFKERKQPAAVFYSKSIEVNALWEVNQEWDINQIEQEEPSKESLKENQKTSKT